MRPPHILLRFQSFEKYCVKSHRWLIKLQSWDTTVLVETDELIVKLTEYSSYLSE